MNLGNVYPKMNKDTLMFIEEPEKDILCTYQKEAMTLIVALHELLGHGTGKLFQLNEAGEKNWPASVKNPFTGEDITTFYSASETWSQKFGKLHSGYEECRADSVALHLIQFKEPFEIFCKLSNPLLECHHPPTRQARLARRTHPKVVVLSH